MSRSAAPDPCPFELIGGNIGVLLIHGFTASPSQMRLIGDDLHQRGLTVVAPLLPGHGTTVADLGRQCWQDWTRHVDLALIDLKSRCEAVFVGGISLGSLLTLYLSAQHPDLRGLILYSPVVKMRAGTAIHLVPIIKSLLHEVPKRRDFVTDPHALDRLWHYRSVSLSGVHEMARLRRRVQPMLPRITCPVLIIYSILDRLIARDSAQYTFGRIGSSDKTLIPLANSGHDVTLDSQWKEVADQTYQFICKCSGAYSSF